MFSTRNNGPSSVVSVVKGVSLQIEPLFSRQPTFYHFKEKGLSVPVIQGYHTALSHVFGLAGINIEETGVVRMLFKRFE